MVFVSFNQEKNAIKKTHEEIICPDNLQEQKVIKSLLNAEQAKLANAKAITLYVTEKVYLATKWVIMKTDHEFIKLKLISSYQWDRDFLW